MADRVTSAVCRTSRKATSLRYGLRTAADLYRKPQRDAEQLTLPYGMRTEFRRSLIDLGEGGFFDVVRKVERNLRSVLGTVPDAQPWFNAIQRHYRSQRSMRAWSSISEPPCRAPINTRNPKSIHKPNG